MQVVRIGHMRMRVMHGSMLMPMAVRLHGRDGMVVQMVHVVM